MSRAPSPTSMAVLLGLLAACSMAEVSSAQTFYVGEEGGTIGQVNSGSSSTFTTNTSEPEGMAVDSNNNLIVADASANAVYSFAPGGVRSTFASGLMGPGDIAIDPQGNVYVANSAAGTILKYGPGGGAGTTYASGLLMPEALTFDPAGDLYIAEEGNGSANTGLLAVIATVDS